jgi:hypothetical protein
MRMHTSVLYKYEGAARGTHTPTRYHVKTLDTTSSQPNPEILAVREVLAHPHAVFYPYTCGLRRGAAAVLISYDDVEVAIRMITRRRRS